MRTAFRTMGHRRCHHRERYPGHAPGMRTRPSGTMRCLTVRQNELHLEDEVETVFEKTVTRFGSGAKVDCPRQYLGRRVYVIVRKEE